MWCISPRQLSVCRLKKIKKIIDYNKNNKNPLTMDKQKIYKMVVTIVTALLTCLAIAFGLTSCNVVRTITNRSEFYQKGDTSIMIQTKTTESYDAKKNFIN